MGTDRPTCRDLKSTPFRTTANLPLNAASSKLSNDYRSNHACSRHNWPAVGGTDMSHSSPSASSAFVVNFVFIDTSILSNFQLQTGGEVLWQKFDRTINS